MAWTAPMTFTANSALTAAQLNTHLRDNLLETAPAKATSAGSIFVGTGANSIAERIPQIHDLGTESGTTTSTTFTNLTGATVGPTVTCETGARALIFTTARCENTSATAAAYAGWECSGATSISAAISRSIHGRNGSGEFLRATAVHLERNLTPGTNTFTMKYAVASGTGQFEGRTLIVIPM